MKYERYEKVAQALRTLGCCTKNGVLLVPEIEKLIQNIQELKAEFEFIVKLYDTAPFAGQKVVMNKEGKHFLVKTHKLGKDKEENVIYAGVEVIDVNGAISMLSIEEAVLYNKTSELLFVKE